MDKDIRFVTGEPALFIRKTLVVSDLHIGIEHRYRKKGISLPSQSGRMLERLERLVRETKARKMVVIGDVKHKVPGTSFQEEREIPAFFRRLLELGEVEVTPGNHDGGIEGLLPPEVVLHPGSGFMLDGNWLCHGHAWPPEGVLKAGRVVTGHNHAGFEFRDRLGYRWVEPVWVRASLDEGKLEERYGKVGSSTPELVLIPPFNEFTGYIGLNRKGHGEDGPGPLFRAARRDSARVYMLDGTLLGELGKLRNPNIG